MQTYEYLFIFNRVFPHFEAVNLYGPSLVGKRSQATRVIFHVVEIVSRRN